jgi:hypothetical protein
MDHLTPGPSTFPPRDLDHSVTLDMTLSSPDGAISELSRHLLTSGLSGLTRKGSDQHLQLVLANFYAAWEDDPKLSLAVSMTNSGYKARSRYNPLKTSNQIIEVIGQLAKHGFIHGASGFQDRVRGFGRNTRVWPSSVLVGLLEQVRAKKPVLAHAAGTEVIVLRDAKRRAVEYEDTSDTCGMRARLSAYNVRLSKTFIDIPELEDPIIPMVSGRVLRMTERAKLVRRVFNQSSWNKGGRFYGGWWQGCPKAWRSKIFINDQPTIEDDYSGLHIVMLYAKKGIDYWATVGSEEDPYRVDVTPDFLEDATVCRKYAKTLLLMAINASSDKTAYQAFRADRRQGGDALGASLKDTQLAVILGALKAKHEPIAEFFGADAGIDLMNQDAQITDEVIGQFVAAGRAVLTIHDSYIVALGDDDRLRVALQYAFEKVTGVSTVHLKRSGVGFQDARRALLEQNPVSETRAHRSPGYVRRLEAFHSS